MKPPAFQYAAPATPAEALQLMATHGDDARALAGGQSLVPMMNFRLVAPAFVIDLNRLREWRFIERRADDFPHLPLQQSFGQRVDGQELRRRLLFLFLC